VPYAKPDEVSPTPWYTLVLDLKKHTSSPLVGTLRVYSPYSANYAGWKDRYQNWKPRLQTWPQPQKYSSQRRKSTSMFPWLKTRGCEVTLHFTTYRFQVAEIIGTWDAGQHTHFFVQRPLVLHLPVCHVLFQRYLLFNYRLRGQTWVPRSSSHCETICLYDGLPQQVHCDTICLCELLDSGYQGWWYVKNLGRSHMSRIRYKTTCLKPPYFWDERSCLKPSYSWDETNGRKPPYSWGETKCLTLHNILLKRIVGNHHTSEMKRFVFMMVCLKPIVNRFVFMMVCLKNA
jgi:hypothetical protein